jgi:hypothetical protein
MKPKSRAAAKTIRSRAVAGAAIMGKCWSSAPSGARRTLPDKPSLALPIGRRLRRRTYTPSTTCNLASIRKWSSASTTAPEHTPRRSIGHAHTGESGRFVGVAAISLAGSSKTARRSAQRGILAGPRLTLLFSTTERSRQSAA